MFYQDTECKDNERDCNIYRRKTKSNVIDGITDLQQTRSMVGVKEFIMRPILDEVDEHIDLINRIIIDTFGDRQNN